MALVRMNHSRNPLNSSFFADFDRLFNELNSTVKYNESLNHSADLYETDDQLVLEMLVPGLEAKDLDISVEDRKLIIKANFEQAETDTNTEHQDRRYWMQSISRKDFSRSLKLPNSINVDAIDANVEKGILRLSMPKVAEAKVKKIKIANN